MTTRWARLRAVTLRDLPTLLLCVVLVPVISGSVRAKGMQWTADHLAKRSNRASGRPDFERAALMSETVAVAAKLTPIPVRCLPRSLTLWFLLRRRGMDADLVIGALPPRGRGLVAHSWVELDGRPLNDQPDIRERFGSFGAILPGLLPGSTSS